MEYKNVMLLLILIILTDIISCTDYCEIEKKTCNERKHIGCETNEFIATKSYIIQPMSERIKETILNILNTFRSDVAMGKYENIGFPKASNMRLLRWNDEFSFLSQLFIKKDPNNIYSACANTEEFKEIVQFQSSEYDLFNETVLFRKVLAGYTPISGLSMTWVSRFYHANNYQYGCALGNLIDNDGDTEHFVKCIQNEGSVRSVNDLYDFGFPCSKCGMWNEVCDTTSRYPGLCEPRQSAKDPHILIKEITGKGEKGAKGDKGNTGLIGISGPVGPFGNKGEKGEPGLIGKPGIGQTGKPGLVGPSSIGEKGYQGIVGPKGEKGNIGMTGLPGLPGSCGVCEKSSQGLTGLPGKTGEIGSPGIGIRGLPGLDGRSVKGDKGSSGSPGEKGITGLKGSPGVGEPGSPGLPGIKGQTGLPGLQGMKGERGSYGIDGLPGQPGNSGIKGEKGSTAAIGIKGEKGSSGAIGEHGIAGPVGLRGTKGDQGLVGMPGMPGLLGPPGPIGPPGIDSSGIIGKYDIVAGPPGPPGIPGPPGQPCDISQIGFNYPFSFWLLYSIMGIGVLTSFLLSLEVIRNGYRKFFPVSSLMELNETY